MTENKNFEDLKNTVKELVLDKDVFNQKFLDWAKKDVDLVYDKLSNTFSYSPTTNTFKILYNTIYNDYNHKRDKSFEEYVSIHCIDYIVCELGQNVIHYLNDNGIRLVSDDITNYVINKTIMYINTKSIEDRILRFHKKVMNYWFDKGKDYHRNKKSVIYLNPKSTF
jgi:hypothetical protein